MALTSGTTYQDAPGTPVGWILRCVCIYFVLGPLRLVSTQKKKIKLNSENAEADSIGPQPFFLEQEEETRRRRANATNSLSSQPYLLKAKCLYIMPPS
jgi:hypothetical protein